MNGAEQIADAGLVAIIDIFIKWQAVLLRGLHHGIRRRIEIFNPADAQLAVAAMRASVPPLAGFLTF